MPVWPVYENVEWGVRRKAWYDHYIAKGCTPRKARVCADRKRFTNTWPQ
jgi:hypothetical protein